MAKKSTKDSMDNLSIEESFEQLDDIMEKLQDEDIKLEESFELYKKGMEMLAHCKEVIDDVEKKVQILSDNSDDAEDEE